MGDGEVFLVNFTHLFKLDDKGVKTFANPMSPSAKIVKSEKLTSLYKL